MKKIAPPTGVDDANVQPQTPTRGMYQAARISSHSMLPLSPHSTPGRKEATNRSRKTMFHTFLSPFVSTGGPGGQKIGTVQLSLGALSTTSFSSGSGTGCGSGSGTGSSSGAGSGSHVGTLAGGSEHSSAPRILVRCIPSTAPNHNPGKTVTHKCRGTVSRWNWITAENADMCPAACTDALIEKSALWPSTADITKNDRICSSSNVQASKTACARCY